MSTDSNSGVQTSKVANFFSMNAWWYAAAALMLLVLIGLIATFMLPNDDDTAADTQPNPSVPPSPLSSAATTTPQPASATGWDDLGCNGTQGSTDIPTLPPKATWKPYGSLSVPSSTKYGPAQAEGYLRRCYQHTPTGALFAATNAFVIATTVPTSDRDAVLSALMTPGEGRDATIAGGIPESAAVRFPAFRVESCVPSRCNIRLITSIGEGVGYADFSMVWSNGDWLLDGAQEPQGGPLDSVPAGYVAWGA